MHLGKGLMQKMLQNIKMIIDSLSRINGRAVRLPPQDSGRNKEGR
ncbi:hypothetical protein BTH41_03485 [Bacillus mycoides]|nr:hypothetical protein BTH41_03485 [Bacillus mycoides]